MSFNANPPPSVPWPRWLRVVVSCLLLVHLGAVFVPPFAFATQGPSGPSPFAAWVAEWFRAYFQPMFLDHGYAFFAPEPGPSHLLRCRLEFADGRPDVELIFPDRTKQKPRLLYHRHFMLAEQLHAMFAPETPPATSDPQVINAWRRDRERYVRRRDSFAAHLRAVYGAERVEITRVEHRIPSPEQHFEGLKLTDPTLYDDLPEVLDELLTPEEVLP